MQLWGKSEAYYFRSILRVQRLWEVSPLHELQLFIRALKTAVRELNCTTTRKWAPAKFSLDGPNDYDCD